MRTLTIDCATEACSVALFGGGDLIEGTFVQLGRGHAESLLPMIAALPGRGKAERIAVAMGPGSFTGVRVGLAAARALAFAWNARLVGYPTLELVAAMARAQHGPQPVAAVMTGGHGEWFVQEFDEAGRAQGDLSSLGPAAAAAQVAAPLVAGSRAEDLVSARGTGTALPLWPDARAAMLLGEAAFTDDVRPLYGRAPDARLPAARP